MSQYSNFLTTLTELKRVRNIAASTTDDDVLRKCILQASRWFEETAERSFVPYRETSEFDYCNPFVLYVDGDLLEVKTLTNGDASTLTASDYVLRPNNIYPKYKVELKRYGDAAFVYDEHPEQALSLDAVWGFHANYNRAWVAADTLDAAIASAGQSTLVVTDADGLDDRAFTRFEVYDYIKVDDEFMLVTAITTNTLTVTRGVNGTTAGTHTDESTVYTYRPHEDIRRAVTYLAGYLYDTRDTTGERIEVMDFALKVKQQIPSEAVDVANRYRKKSGEVL